LTDTLIDCTTFVSSQTAPIVKSYKFAYPSDFTTFSKAFVNYGYFYNLVATTSQIAFYFAGTLQSSGEMAFDTNFSSLRCKSINSDSSLDIKLGSKSLTTTVEDMEDSTFFITV